MKYSGVEWIGNIPDSWKVERLQWHLDEIKESNNPIKTRQVLSLTNKLGVIPYEEKGDHGNKAKENYDEYKIAYPNTIVANSMNILIGSVGKCEYYGCVSPVYYVFKPKENNIDFLNYIFQSREFQKNLRQYANGILEIRLRLSSTDILKREIAVPSKEEQDAIVITLNKKCSEIDELIEVEQRQIDNLKEYKTAKILDIISRGIGKKIFKDSNVDWIGKIPQDWILTKIKFVSDICRGLFNHRPRNDERLYGGAYPFIQTGDVARANKYIESYSQTLNEYGISVSKCFPVGTLTMTIAANVGDVSILTFDAYFPDSVVGFIPHNGVNSEYLYYVFSAMKSEFIRASIVSTQLNLNIERIKEMYIPFTNDTDEQQAIVDYLNGKVSLIDELIELKNKKIEQLKEYKKALIYEYVTGKRKSKHDL